VYEEPFLIVATSRSGVVVRENCVHLSLEEATALGAAIGLIARILSLVLHRRWFRQGFVGDSSVHWAIARALRQKPTARFIDEYVISPEPMSYPTGFHRFTALFPLGFLEAHSWLPNAVLWVAGVAGFAGYSEVAARSLLHLDPVRTVWLELAFVIFVPSSTVFRGPAIAYLKFSERLLGRLATAFAVLLLAVGTAANDGPSLLAACLAVAIALTSSVFARQALSFGLPLLALLWWDWRPLAVLAAGTVLAVVFSRSRFVCGLRHTWIQNRTVYPRLVKASKHVTSVLSRFVRPPELLAALRDFDELKLMLEREPLRAIIMYPEVLAAAVLLAIRRPPHTWHWAALLVAFVALYVLTSTRRFNHLGEAYRYLEFGLFFVVPLTVALTLQRWSAWELVALVGTVVAWSAVLTGRLVVVSGGWLRGMPDRDVLREFLKRVNLRPGDVVFPVSMRLGADICARLDGVRSFWWQPGVVATTIFDEFIEEYPYLKRDYWPLVEKYGVTHVICDKAALDQIDWAYDFSELVPLAEDERYLAFAVRQTGGEHDSPSLREHVQ
jgi:hypothetical protein